MGSTITEPNPDLKNFELRKKEIHAALKGSTGIVNGVFEENKEDVFYMLLFCLCVPQSKAVKAQKAINMLRRMNFYHVKHSLPVIREILKPNVRFYTVKAKRLMEAKENFEKVWPHLKIYYEAYKKGDNQFLPLKNIRFYLVQDVKGFGYKAASHFMRNIGMGGLCIIDTHIMDGLLKRGLLDRKPKSLTAKKYCELEDIMINYAESIGLSVDELDLLWWSDKTGYVFK